MYDESDGVKPAAAVRPLFVSKLNSVAVTGVDFRRWKDHYPHLVRRVGRKDVIVAADLERAVQQSGAKAPTHQLVTAEVVADPAEQVRQLLRRAGGQ
jgi:hypothetical protein